MNADQLSQTVAQLQQMCNAARYDEVERRTRPLIQAHPRDPRVMFVRAVSLGHCGRRPEARRLLQGAIALQPNVPAYYQMLAYFCLVDERFDEAHRAYDDALTRWPGHVTTASLKADLHVSQREYDAAAALLEPFLHASPPDIGVARSFARLALATGQAARAAALMERALAAPDLRPKMRAHALFQLGTLLDRLERYDDAFDAFRHANELQQGRYDAAGHGAEIERIIRTWSPERMQTLPRLTDTPAPPRPIFIVGILRSGSSLLEQILDAHPHIRGMGEWPVLHEGIRRLIGAGELPRPADIATRLTGASLRQWRDAVLAAARERCAGTPHFTDKQLGNIHWLGLISLAFPEAPILICTRDHLDTCLSAWFQDLPNLHTHRLEDMGRYCLTLDRLTDHWRRVIANPVMTVRYEDMALKQEETTRAVLDFLGVPWDAACLRFHENRRVTVTVSNQQVARPMYASSVGRHRHYERYLGPLREILGTAGP